MLLILTLLNTELSDLANDKRAVEEEADPDEDEYAVDPCVCVGHATVEEVDDINRTNLSTSGTAVETPDFPLLFLCDCGSLQLKKLSIFIGFECIIWPSSSTMWRANFPKLLAETVGFGAPAFIRGLGGVLP